MKKRTLLKWAAGGALAAGAAETGMAGAIFHVVFTRRRPTGSPIPGLHGNDGDSNYFAKYSDLKEAGQAWLKEKEATSERWTVFSQDGLKLCARFIPTEGESKRTVICVHGYHSTGEEEYVLMARMFHDSGYHVLLIDQRTHGASEGKYIGFGCLERKDLLCWIQEVDRRFDGQGEIFLHGVSMGGATVLMASGLELPPSVKGIAADCGFTTPKAILRAVVREGMVKVPFAGAIIETLDAICKVRAGFGLESCSALEAVAKSNCPIFIIHGDRDMLVPVEMARELYRACGGPKRLWIVEGANHAESSCMKPEEYQKQVTEFFDSCLEA